MTSPDDTRGVLVSDLRSGDGPYVPPEMATADIPLPDDTLYPRPAISLHSSRAIADRIMGEIGNDGMPIFLISDRYQDLAARATEVARATGQSPRYVEALMLRAIEDGEPWPAAPMIRNDDATPEDIIDAVLGANSDAEILGYALDSADAGEIARVGLSAQAASEAFRDTAEAMRRFSESYADDYADTANASAEALTIDAARREFEFAGWPSLCDHDVWAPCTDACLYPHERTEPHRDTFAQGGRVWLWPMRSTGCVQRWI